MCGLPKGIGIKPLFGSVRHGTFLAPRLIMDVAHLQSLAFPIFAGLAGAAGVALCRPFLAARLGALVAAICFLAYAAMAGQVSVGTSLVTPFWAIPSLGLAGGLRLDG